MKQNIIFKCSKCKKEQSEETFLNALPPMFYYSYFPRNWRLLGKDLICGKCLKEHLKNTELWIKKN